MAWKHAKPDRSRTAALYILGKYKHPDSFVDVRGCDHLEGVDKSIRRAEIFERARNLCELRLAVCTPVAEEWHHTRAHFKMRCDCLDGGAAACRPCHRASHVQVGLRRAARAPGLQNAR